VSADDAVAPGSPAHPSRADDSLAGDVVAHKLAAARLWATNRYPYLATALFASPASPAPELGRLVIDRWWRVHADPEVVASATVPELGGELLHLATHVLRDHANRADTLGFSDRGELHHWVDAADAEICDDFPTDLHRVSPPVTPADLVCDDGRLAEEYYRRGIVRQETANDCGSGAHGHSPEWEPPPPADRSDPGVDQHDQRLIRRKVAADVASASPDAVGASLRRWAEGELRPQIDWRVELAAVLRRSLSSVSGAVDYSYRRPSRRATASPGVVLPSLVRPSVGVAVLCDTSASVSDEQLGAALAEVDGLLRATGTRSVTVLAVDAAINAVSTVTSGRDVRLVGGGGTDLRVGLDGVADLRPRPQVVVAITDGFTPWPERPPPVELVVALVEGDNHLAPPEPPAWARTVRVPAPHP
jgi:predicted metal-dependent peptidase